MSEARRVAVIGSNSFSGSDFVDLLLDRADTEVLGISRSREKGPLFLPYLSKKSGRFHFLHADMNHDAQEILAELDRFRPQYIVNFVALSEVAKSWEYPEHFLQTNVLALATLLQGLKDCSYMKRYVQISSPEVYGTCTGTVAETMPLNPSTPYAASKASADLLLQTYVKAFNFPAVTVRATNVYGAHQQLFKIIPRSIIRLKRGERIELHGGGSAVKSFIHIRDVSRGEEAVMEYGQPGEIYHLSPDDSHSIRDLVGRICRVLGKDERASTLAVSERLGQDAAYVIDSSKARTAFQWAPRISIDQGISGTIEWIERFWSEIQAESHEYIHAA